MVARRISPSPKLNAKQTRGVHLSLLKALHGEMVILTFKWLSDFILYAELTSKSLHLAVVMENGTPI